MTQALSLGPVVLPLALLVLLAALALGGLVARLLARRAIAHARRTLWQALLAGLLGARALYVLRYRGGYLETPLSVLDLRDGGWDAQGGFVVAWIYGLAAAHGRRALRRPVVGALATATLAWGAGAVALALQRTPAPTLAQGAARALVPADGAGGLAAFAGKPAVVNLWATWCPPCRAELPMLARAQAAHPELHFVFIDQGEGRAAVDGYLAASRLVLRNVLLDPRSEAGRAWGGVGLPTTLYFDAQGRLVGSHLGELSTGSLAEGLARLQAAPAASAPAR